MDDPPIFDPYNAVRKVEDTVIVGDDNDGISSLTAEIFHQYRYRPTIFSIQSGRRLIS